MIFQCTIRPLAPIPIALAALVTLMLPLPLRTWTVGAAALTLAALTIASLRSTKAAALPAALALSTVGAIVLGYAAYALVRVGVFGPVNRLGYPFLVATGLRLEGGAWLVLLCGLVSLVPSLFRPSR